MSDRPMLQLALDDPKSALETARRAGAYSDVIEAGTLLCLSEGLGVIRSLRKICPEQPVVADVRIVRAGHAIASLAFDAGADWVTVAGEAPLGTVEAAVRAAMSCHGEIQVELHPDWTREQAKEWHQLGIRHVICQNSSEVAAVGSRPSRKLVESIHQLADLGFDVSLAGGITRSTVTLFSGIPVRIFVAGRSIVEASDPGNAAHELRIAIRQGV